MKKLLVLVLVVAFISAGCATMQENPKTTIGAATGAVLGAGLGYGLGKGKGAAIGAVVGGLAGGAIGHYMDKQKREFDQMLAESQAREQNAILQGVQKEQDALILTFKSDVLFDTNSSTKMPLVKGSKLPGYITVRMPNSVADGALKTSEKTPVPPVRTARRRAPKGIQVFPELDC